MASAALTDRQIKELNQSILEYLLSNQDKYAQTIESFREEAGLQSATNSGKGLLEKKWVSVVRLQKRVMELETRLASSAALPSADESGTSGASLDASKLLPKAPSKAELTGHRDPVTCLAMHPKYSLCASGSEDTTIRLWDFESCQYERTLKGHTGPVTGVAFEPVNGNILVSCSSDMTAKLWDVSSGGQYNCTKTLRGHDHSISGVAFAVPACDFVLTCSRDQTIKCWEVATGYCSRTYSGHSEWVKCISVSLDGEWVASGSSDHTIMVFKISNGNAIQTLRGHEHVVESVCFGKKPVIAMVDENLAAGDSTASESHPFSYLASGSRDKTVRLWDVLKGSCLGVFTFHTNWVRGVAFHSSGKYIISCADDRSIRVVDIKQARCVRSLEEAHSHFVTCLALPPAGHSPYRCILSGSVDRSLRVWGCS